MVSRLTSKNVIGGILGAGLLGFIVYAFSPQPVAVDLATIDRGPLIYSISDDGKTRVKDVFVVSAPVGGRLLRIEKDVGDAVIANETVLATLLPSAPAFLDKRSAREAAALVEAAKAALSLSRSDVKSAEAEVDFARAELGRSEELAANHTVSQAALDRDQLHLRTSLARLDTARSAVAVRQAELETARAALINPEDASADGPTSSGLVTVRAPVTGKVLTVLHESEGIVAPGTGLIEIGDPTRLEIVADFLSTDAVLVRDGGAVLIEGWGGEPLKAHVRRVEPTGFTKISALGIEEQRVNIIIDFDGPGDAYQRLGHGFRVEPRIILWQGDDVLRIPTSALFRTNGIWTTFKVIGGTAVLTAIETGHGNENLVEVLSGLEAGDRVVLHPGDQVTDGVSIVVREAGL